MTYPFRVALFGLTVLAVTACQVGSPAQPTLVNTANPSPVSSDPSTASIEGVIWHDLCDSGNDDQIATTLLPRGCVEGNSQLGRYEADGVRQSGEPGLPGVRVALSAGKCPGGEVQATTLSDPSGTYLFSNLQSGDYCVSIDPASVDNQERLLSGEWTHPRVPHGSAAMDVRPIPGEDAAQVDFGWDRQFLPTDLHAAIWDNQGQLQVVDTGAARDGNLPAPGALMPIGGVAQGQVYAYAYDTFHPTPDIMMTTDDGLHQVAFIEGPDHNLAVWPGQGDRPPQLAWSLPPRGEGTASEIWISDLAGTTRRNVYSEPFEMSHMTQLLVQGWTSDGQSLLFSREPMGMGGYYVFIGASSLYQLSLADGQVTPIVEYEADRSTWLCLDALSPDRAWLAVHCRPSTHIALRNLSGGVPTTISPPEEVGQDFITGSARFSPDGDRIAYGLAIPNPDGEQGWVAVSDGLSGGSHIVVARAGGHYQVATWLNQDTLLVQWIPVPCGDGCAGDSLWTVGVDGTGLTQVAQGTFVTLTHAMEP